MSEQNLLDYSLTEIHKNENNFGFNFGYFTEERKILLNTNEMLFLPRINTISAVQEKVLDRSKQQWKNDVSQSNDNHIVSPEAILEALQEEKEEAMGMKPFSNFTSFNALKQRRYSTETIPFNSPSNENIPLEKQEIKPQETTHQQKLKRPPNAYLLFNRDMRRKLLISCPKMSVAEISKEIGDTWRGLPHGQRDYYFKTASKLKEEHLTKYPGYTYTRRSKAQLAEDKKLGNRSKSDKLNYHYEYADTSHPFVVSEDTDIKRPRKFVPKRDSQRDPRGRKKKRTKHPFAPKHPMSAYLHYVSSVYQQVSSKFPGSTVGPISKSISKTWHSLSPEERLPWTKKAESDKARYAYEMQIYNLKQQRKHQDSSSSEDEDVDMHTLETVVNMVNNGPNGNPMYYSQ